MEGGANFSEPWKRYIYWMPPKLLRATGKISNCLENSKSLMFHFRRHGETVYIIVHLRAAMDLNWTTASLMKCFSPVHIFLNVQYYTNMDRWCVQYEFFRGHIKFILHKHRTSEFEHVVGFLLHDHFVTSSLIGQKRPYTLAMVTFPTSKAN